jgi:DNA-directed RNA polymerase subunit RPC12/RpoP
MWSASRATAITTTGEVVWSMMTSTDRVAHHASVVSEGDMPRLACWSCGRQIYTVAPLESLFSEERRCPRCGAFLDRERREVERRVADRRIARRRAGS